MDSEHVMFQHPVEFYRELHAVNFRKATEFQSGINTTEVRIVEPDLESHFEAVWGEAGEDYRNDVERWRQPDSPLTNLTVLVSETSSEKAFVVDTSDLLIGKPEDEFFFYQIGTCWAVVADIDTGEAGSLRIAFHLPGITVNKDFSLGEFVKAASDKGKLTKLTVFYNSKKYDKAPKDMVGNVLPDITRYIDMNELDDAGVHDLYIKGDQASQHYNHGEYNAETETAKVWRLYSGVWKF